MARTRLKRPTVKYDSQQAIEDELQKLWRRVQSLYIEAAQKAWHVEKLIRHGQVPMMASDFPTEAWMSITECMHSINLLQQMRLDIQSKSGAVRTGSSYTADSPTETSPTPSKEKPDSFH